MKTPTPHHPLFKPTLFLLLAFVGSLLNSCKDEETFIPAGDLNLTGNTKQYALSPVSNPDLSGTVTFLEKKDNITSVRIKLTAGPVGVPHPAHIHLNTAAEGGAIVISLNDVDGESGYSETDVTKRDDGTPVSYAQLIDFNGYVNVHASQDNLGELIAQGDIGINELSTTSKTYSLDTLGAKGLKGTATFTKRVNGTTLFAIALDKATAGNQYPAQLHLRSAAEGEGIAKSLTSVNGTTGKGATNIKKLDDGTDITYDQLMDFDGHLRVYEGTADLANAVSQGDIGGNELTTTTKTYQLFTKQVARVNGTARFDKRKNGNTLVTLNLNETTAGNQHPAHVHLNTAVEGGAIVISLADVNGTTGRSRTTVRKMDGASGMAISYDSLVTFNGYINVHQSMADLGTLLAQGDIGKNELTGKKEEYRLDQLATTGFGGTARFEERASGSTLVTLTLVATPASGSYPARILTNSAAEGGKVVVSLNNVDGRTGISQTNVKKLDAAAGDTTLRYARLLEYNGHLNVYAEADLNTAVAQGDVGINKLTGASRTYPLLQKDVTGISGDAKFEERKNGSTLVTLTLSGTTAGVVYPAHLFKNVAGASGEAVVDLRNVDGQTGVSKTNVKALKDGKAITYSGWLTYNGYLNVYLGQTGPGTIVAQGNVGSTAF